MGAAEKSIVLECIILSQWCPSPSWVKMSEKTFQPLKIRTLNCLAMSGSNTPIDTVNNPRTDHQTRSSLKIQWGLVLRWFVLWWFISMTLAETDQALPTCGASLSQLEHPFSTQCTSSSFPVCMCFWLWFLYPRRPSRRQIILFCKKEQKEQERLWL